MKDSRALSSVQALDDYFDALLDDDSPLQGSDTDAKLHAAEGSLTLQPQPVVIEPIEKFGGATLTKDERDLSSVEKLLSQLKLDEDLEVEVEALTETDVITDSELAVETYTEQLTDVAVDVAVEADVETVVDAEVITETETVVEQTVDIEPEVISEVDVEVSVETEVAVEAAEDVAQDIETETETQAEPQTQEDADTTPPWKNIAPEHAFQVLFFESVGVTYAVPLAELGGIHRLESCNHLIGRPDWYLGLQTERDQQLDVVDTAMWVMPEKITDNSHRDDYSYIVILGDSKWGLACNALLGTESLTGERVRWREQAGKRPWLAGLVKDKMCALIHVEALIAMLDQGIDANALA